MAIHGKAGGRGHHCTEPQFMNPNGNKSLRMGFVTVLCARAVPGIVLTGILAGCGQTAPIVSEEPEELVESIVTGPLPGVDPSVIQDVAVEFDSTFVAHGPEVEAQQSYLAGQSLFDHADSILTRIAGPSRLLLESDNNVPLDSLAFERANNAAQTALGQAARAQLQQDTTLAHSLLDQAAQHYERALSFNPYHEESRYQLAQVYTLRANHFRQSGAWDRVLGLLRELAKLREGQHGLWAEMGVALENLGQHQAAGVVWRRAARTVADDSWLAFASPPPPIDSTTYFLYNVRAYQAFASAGDSEAVRASLADAWTYAPTKEQWNYVQGEMVWSLWDGDNFESRLVFDRLQTMSETAPFDVLDGLESLIPRLTRLSARLDAGYVYSVVSYDNGFQDIALDSLQALWRLTNDGLAADVASRGSQEQVAWENRYQWDANSAREAIVQEPLPYPTYMSNLRTAYSTFLFERAIQHIQDGGSALAFTYLIQVTETGSAYTGRAFVEALKLARYNPPQALKLEPRIEAVYDQMSNEDKMVYLQEIGDLHRRLGNMDRVAELVDRYRGLQGTNSQ